LMVAATPHENVPDACGAEPNNHSIPLRLNLIASSPDVCPRASHCHGVLH
jgi:hypothetical protein